MNRLEQAGNWMAGPRPSGDVLVADCRFSREIDRAVIYTEAWVVVVEFLCQLKRLGNFRLFSRIA